MSNELEQLGERIAEHAAHLDAAMHRLLTDIREFDQRGGWCKQGALSCAHWLSWRVGWTLGTARDHVRIAGKLGGLPEIDDSLRRGEISYSKVRAMARVATPENESLLLDHARLLTGAQLEQTCRKLALVQRNGEDPHPLGDLQRRHVRRRDTEDGMVKIEVVLHPEEAELVWTMLNHAATQLGNEPGSSTCAVSVQAHKSVPAHSIACTMPFSDIEVSPVDDSTDARCQDKLSAETQETCHTATTSPFTHMQALRGSVSAETPEQILACGESLLDRLLDEPDARREAEAAAGATTDPGTTWSEAGQRESEPQPRASMLHERADVTRRAFNRADALVAVAQGYLRGDRPNRSPIEITLTIPASSLRAGEGDPVDVAAIGESFVSREAARRLSCDCGVVEIMEDELGTPLSMGRKRRTISGPLKRALHQRDKICTYPGCTNRLFLEGHHVRHWADGGETSLMNAILLCTQHHHFVHEYGYAIELGPDQRPQFRDPQGRLVAAAPARSTTADLGWPHIRAANELLAISAASPACGWDGSTPDYGRIVGHLLAANEDRELSLRWPRRV